MARQNTLTLLQSEAEDADLEGVARPHFPVIIFSVALVKDFIDIMSFGFLGWFTGAVAGFTIWLWLLNKTSFVKKRMTRWMVRRSILIVLAAIGEVLPVSSMIPTATIFVLLAHNREKKIVQDFYKVLEKLHPTG